MSSSTAPLCALLPLPLPTSPSRIPRPAACNMVLTRAQAKACSSSSSSSVARVLPAPAAAKGKALQKAPVRRAKKTTTTTTTTTTIKATSACKEDLTKQAAQRPCSPPPLPSSSIPLPTCSARSPPRASTLLSSSPRKAPPSVSALKVAPFSPAKKPLAAAEKTTSSATASLLQSSPRKGHIDLFSSAVASTPAKQVVKSATSVLLGSTARRGGKFATLAPRTSSTTSPLNKVPLKKSLVSQSPRKCQLESPIKSAPNPFRSSGHVSLAAKPSLRASQLQSPPRRPTSAKGFRSPRRSPMSATLSRPSVQDRLLAELGLPLSPAAKTTTPVFTEDAGMTQGSPTPNAPCLALGVAITPLTPGTRRSWSDMVEEEEEAGESHTNWEAEDPFLSPSTVTPVHKDLAREQVLGSAPPSPTPTHGKMTASMDFFDDDKTLNFGDEPEFDCIVKPFSVDPAAKGLTGIADAAAKLGLSKAIPTITTGTVGSPVRKISTPKSRTARFQVQASSPRTPETRGRLFLPEVSPMKSCLKSPVKSRFDSPSKKVVWGVREDNEGGITDLIKTPERETCTDLAYFVDVKTMDGTDFSNEFTAVLKTMDIPCVSSTQEEGITHVLFRYGNRATLEWADANKDKVKLVDLSWAQACEDANERVDETPYLLEARTALSMLPPVQSPKSKSTSTLKAQSDSRPASPSPRPKPSSKKPSSTKPSSTKPSSTKPSSASPPQSPSRSGSVSRLSARKSSSPCSSHIPTSSAAKSCSSSPAHSPASAASTFTTPKRQKQLHGFTPSYSLGFKSVTKTPVFIFKEGSTSTGTGTPHPRSVHHHHAQTSPTSPDSPDFLDHNKLLQRSAPHQNHSRPIIKGGDGDGDGDGDRMQVDAVVSSFQRKLEGYGVKRRKSVYPAWRP